MDELIIGGVSASVLIVGLVQIAKSSGLPGRWAPLLSVGLGLAFAVAYGLLNRLTGPVWLDLVGLGILAGLSASGLYSGVRALRE